MVEFRETVPMSTWRKIAMGTWRTPSEPTVLAVLKIDATNLLARRQAVRAAWHDANVQDKTLPTLTALAGCAVALTMKRYPQLNGMIRWGRVYLRRTVTLFYQTAVDPEGKELSGVRVENAETKNVYDIMSEIDAAVEKVRSGKDPVLQKTKSQFALIPGFLMRWVLNLTSFLIYTLNLDLSRFGVPKDPFGSVMITNIGTLGVGFVFGPLVGYSRTPLLLTIGNIVDEPVVRNGKLEVAPIITICGTMDHRMIDGLIGARMMKLFQHYLETNEGLDELGFKLP